MKYGCVNTDFIRCATTVSMIFAAYFIYAMPRALPVYVGIIENQQNLVANLNSNFDSLMIR